MKLLYWNPPLISHIRCLPRPLSTAVVVLCIMLSIAVRVPPTLKRSQKQTLRHENERKEKKKEKKKREKKERIEREEITCCYHSLSHHTLFFFWKRKKEKKKGILSVLRLTHVSSLSQSLQARMFVFFNTSILILILIFLSGPFRLGLNSSLVRVETFHFLQSLTWSQRRSP